MAWRWVATGVYPAFSMRVQVWTRFEQNAVYPIEYDLVDYRSAIVRLPDRTLFMANPTEPWDIWPDGRWDEVCDLDPYRGEWGEGWLPFVMMSAHNGMTTQSHHGTSTGCRSRHWLQNGVQLMGDSGGSQLKSGTTDYVDPEAALVWMNQICDIGAPLDIAPQIVDRFEPNILKPLVELQKRHNRMWLERARETTPDLQGLRLQNPAHGFTIDQVRSWCEDVYDERFIGWAVGGDGPSLFQHLRTLLICLLEYNSDHFTHHHMYGAANRTKMPAMAWLSKFFPMITGDGTGWLDGIKYKRMMLPHLNGHQYPEHFGHKAIQAKTVMPLSMSPCSCPACRVIGGRYEVYNMPRATPGQNLLMLHEAYVVANVNRMWDELAQNTDDLEDYIEWIISAYTLAGEKRRTKARNLDVVVNLVRFVDMALQHGVERASKRFQSYMNDDLGGRSLMQPLFQKAASTVSMETFGQSELQEGTRRNVLPNYMTRSEIRGFGVRADDLQPGLAEGGAVKGHAKSTSYRPEDQGKAVRL